VVIFPEKFDGRYARLDCSYSEIAPWSIWISYSPDLRYWGDFAAHHPAGTHIIGMK
jgi:predicted GH43/DUF377 family glycosyl hydrolase